MDQLKANKKLVTIIWVCALSLAVGVIVYGLMLGKSTPNTTPQPEVAVETPTLPAQLPSPTPASTPESVAETFYTWYMSAPKNPISTGEYKTNPLLTEYFIHLTSEFVEGYTRSEPYDPIFCIKNKTKDVRIGPAQYTAKDAVNVLIYRAADNKDIYRVSLVRSNGTWLINDIACRH